MDFWCVFLYGEGVYFMAQGLAAIILGFEFNPFFSKLYMILLGFWILLYGRKIRKEKEKEVH